MRQVLIDEKDYLIFSFLTHMILFIINFVFQEVW